MTEKERRWPKFFVTVFDRERYSLTPRRDFERFPMLTKGHFSESHCSDLQNGYPSGTQHIPQSKIRLAQKISILH